MAFITGNANCHLETLCEGAGNPNPNPNPNPSPNPSPHLETLCEGAGNPNLNPNPNPNPHLETLCEGAGSPNLHPNSNPNPHLETLCEGAGAPDECTPTSTEACTVACTVGDACVTWLPLVYCSLLCGEPSCRKYFLTPSVLTTTTEQARPFGRLRSSSRTPTSRRSTTSGAWCSPSWRAPMLGLGLG